MDITDILKNKAKPFAPIKPNSKPAKIIKLIANQEELRDKADNNESLFGDYDHIVVNLSYLGNLLNEYRRLNKFGKICEDDNEYNHARKRIKTGGIYQEFKKI